MKYKTNNEKMLQAVLLDENLMQIGNYTPDDVGNIGNIFQAIESDNYVISVVAQIIKRTNDGATDATLWKEIKNYLFNNV